MYIISTTAAAIQQNPKIKNKVLKKIQKDEHVHQTILCLTLALCVPLHLFAVVCMVVLLFSDQSPGQDAVSSRQCI